MSDIYCFGEDGEGCPFQEFVDAYSDLFREWQARTMAATAYATIKPKCGCETCRAKRPDSEGTNVGYTGAMGAT